MTLRRLAAAFALALCGAGAAWSQSAIVRESGRASWYGEPFHGRKTASGEVFDMRAMTAAHKTLPFGTRVLVTNLDNGLQVIVRVNDRGPFIAGRIIDLSKSAGALIGLGQSGTASVELRPAPAGADLGVYPAMPSGSPSKHATSPMPRVRIQVASFRDAANAREAAERLRRIGLQPLIELAGAYRRVVVYARPSDRQGVEDRLEAAGWKDRLITEING